MSMRDLEASILAELRQHTGNRKIRQKDIMEWSTGEITAQGDERKVFLPLNRMHVAYVEPPKKTKAP